MNEAHTTFFTDEMFGGARKEDTRLRAQIIVRPKRELLRRPTNLNLGGLRLLELAHNRI